MGRASHAAQKIAGLEQGDRAKDGLSLATEPLVLMSDVGHRAHDSGSGPSDTSASLVTSQFGLVVKGQDHGDSERTGASETIDTSDGIANGNISSLQKIAARCA